MIRAMFNYFKIIFDAIFKTDSSAVMSKFTEEQGGIVPKEMMDGSCKHRRYGDTVTVDKDGEVISVKKLPNKSKVTRKNTPEQNIKISESLKGTTHSPEKRKKLSSALVNYYSDPTNRKKAQDNSVELGLTIPVKIEGVEYCSLTEASIKLKVSIRTVKNRCGSDNWYGWKFVDRDKIVRIKK